MRTATRVICSLGAYARRCRNEAKQHKHPLHVISPGGIRHIIYTSSSLAAGGIHSASDLDRARLSIWTRGRHAMSQEVNNNGTEAETSPHSSLAPPEEPRQEALQPAAPRHRSQSPAFPHHPRHPAHPDPADHIFLERRPSAESGHTVALLQS